jgi:hypothetical protein
LTPAPRCRSAFARESGGGRFASKLAPTGFLGLLFATPVLADLDAATREALEESYYEVEVASYCGLVSEAVAAGFHRQQQRILGGAVVPRETLDTIRGKAWQAAHWEWQNRGLGGFRGWCRKQGQAAAQRFLAEP